MVIKMKYQRIKDLREDSDLTQSQIGEKLNLPQRTYAYYESGERTIPPEILIKLADFYNTSIDYILGRTDKNKDNGSSILRCPLVIQLQFNRRLTFLLCVNILIKGTAQCRIDDLNSPADTQYRNLSVGCQSCQ